MLNEKRLVELFGVSKAPVREALIKLCSEGVLRNVPRYGYVVVKMKEKDARDILKLRCILELEALKDGFEAIIQYHLEDIKRHIDNAALMQQEPVDVWKVWEDNEAFHLLLASYADNQLLNKFLKESLSIQKRIYAQFSWNKSRAWMISLIKNLMWEFIRLCAIRIWKRRRSFFGETFHPCCDGSIYNR